MLLIFIVLIICILTHNKEKFIDKDDYYKLSLDKTPTAVLEGRASKIHTVHNIHRPDLDVRPYEVSRNSLKLRKILAPYQLDRVEIIPSHIKSQVRKLSYI